MDAFDNNDENWDNDGCISLVQKFFVGLIDLPLMALGFVIPLHQLCRAMHQFLDA
jgi:hypothetical protein